jgi:S1-C subfamily serine protease
MKKRILLVAGIVIGVVVLAGAVLLTGAGMARVAAQVGRNLVNNRVMNNTVPQLLGREVQTPTEKGLVIVRVATDSPADKAGVKRGDVLLKVDDKEVNLISDLNTILSGHKAGDTVKLTLTRGGETRTLDATLTDQNGRAFLGLLPFGRGGRIHGLDDMPFGQTISDTHVMVTEVITGSPAGKAGLKRGDMISTIDGKTLGADNNLADIIAAHKPGDNVTLQVTSPGQPERSVSVQLGENPDKKGVAYLGVRYVAGPRGGIFQHGMPFGWPGKGNNATAGALVISVTVDGPAAKAGLKQGDAITAIDGKAITTPQALIDALATHKPTDSVTLSVQHSDGNKADVKVTLGDNPNKPGSAYLGVALARSGGNRMPRFNLDPGAPQTPRGNGQFGGRGTQQPGTQPSLGSTL